MCSANIQEAFTAGAGPGGASNAIRRTKFGKTEFGKTTSRALQVNDPAGTIVATASDKRQREKFKSKAQELFKGKEKAPAPLPETPVPQTDEAERQRRLSELRLRRRRGVGSTKLNTGLGLIGSRASVGKQKTFGA